MSNGANGVESAVVGGTSIIIDAKQRAIIAHYYRDDRATVAVCAEPSPDAVAALSTAFAGSLGGGLFGKTEEDLKISASFSEAVGKLGKRNATIQLLRDALYRQCEAFANGAIKQGEYSSASRRYIDAMVALLAIEQLTNGRESDTDPNAPGQDGNTSAEVTTVAQRLDRAKNPAGESLEAASQTVSGAGGNLIGAGSGEATPEVMREGSDGNTETASAEAADPLVPGNDDAHSRVSSDRIAIEVRTMVEAFFRRGIVSECLALFESGPDLYKLTGGQGPIVQEEYAAFIRARTDIYYQCSDIIAAVAKTAKTQAQQAEAAISRLSNEERLELPKLLLQHPPLY